MGPPALRGLGNASGGGVSLSPKAKTGLPWNPTLALQTLGAFTHESEYSAVSAGVGMDGLHLGGAGRQVRCISTAQGTRPGESETILSVGRAVGHCSPVSIAEPACLCSSARRSFLYPFFSLFLFRVAFFSRYSSP
ncbi:unnamed protein product [Calypogeia fissa]